MARCWRIMRWQTAERMCLPPYGRFSTLDGFLTLTQTKRQAFNEVAEAWEASNPVLYQTYAGSQAFENIMLLLKGSLPVHL